MKIHFKTYNIKKNNATNYLNDKKESKNSLSVSICKLLKQNK